VSQWWFKMPTRAGHRPEMVAVGWSGFCAWLALMDVDAQNGFGGSIPRRFTAPAYLARQLADDGPSPEQLATGVERCIAAGMATWRDGVLELDPEIYAEWTGPKSDRQRKREQREKQRDNPAEPRDVTTGHEMSRSVTPSHHVTLPDQTRPDQTRPDQKDPPPPVGARDPGGTEQRYGLRHGSGVFSTLYEKHVAVVASVAPRGAVKLLGAVNVLHKIRECLNHPAIREQEPAAIERALELLGVQAKAKADAGEADPWWLLENAWSPGVLEKALACRDEDTARQRAVRRSRHGAAQQHMPLPVSQPPAPHEVFVELARKQKAEKEARDGASNPPE
jgi:hypothetical protein